MSDDLFSSRVLVVSTSSDDQDLFRQAASALSVPVEIVQADTAATACRCIADGVDLVFLDATLAGVEIAQVVSAARAAKKPPFTVLVAAPDAALASFETDALATKPSELDDARRLIRRAIRVRLPRRVLVVDDSATMRSIVRKILAATRFPLEVSEADEGFAALKLAREVEFDLVFLDYNMPGFSGLETLAEFKREKRRVNVVIMTSTRDDTLVGRVRGEGAIFLKKPFFPADIDAVLCGFYGLKALNPRRR
jgi:DNA-binding NtrC family response regulator